jgi:hypothetical protein
VPRHCGLGSGRIALRRQVLVDEGNRHAALADGRGDAFDRAQADIAAGEDARRAGFKEIGIAAERPAPGFFQIVAGEDVSARVARDVGRQPRGFRVSADEDEQAAAIMLVLSRMSIVVRWVSP